MRLRAHAPSTPRRVITLVPLVDAMLILLVFFMVTSTYLDLDMLPLSKTAEAGAGAAPTEDRGTLLVRLTATGQAVFRGKRVPATDALQGLTDALSERPGSVQILPAPAAPVGALVAVMEAATRAGASEVRVLRVEGAQ